MAAPAYREDITMSYIKGRVRPGPLTDKQHRIIRLVMSGATHLEAAQELGMSRPYVSQQIAIVHVKMDVQNSAEMCARYGRYLAYKEAAEHIRSGQIKTPVGEAEEHVNHVLTGIAREFELLAEEIVP